MKNVLILIAVAALLLAGLFLALRSNDNDLTGEPIPVASLDRGVELFDQKQFPEALEELQALTSAGSEDWRAWYYLGSTQLMLKDYPAASEALEQSLALRPEETGTLYALGVAYYKQGNLKLAKAYFGAVLEINPNDEHAKGLMDIMNRLEQNSAAGGNSGPESADPPENGS